MTLEAERKKRGLTQEELGRKVGVSQCTIATYESKTRRPSPEVAIKIAQALRITIPEMWAMFYISTESMVG